METTYCQALGRFFFKLATQEQHQKAAEIGDEILTIMRPYVKNANAPAHYGTAYKIALRNQIRVLKDIGDITGVEALSEKLHAFEGMSGENGK